MRNPLTGISKQEEFFFATKRNQCFSGGYGNGKSYIGCLKIYMLLNKFPKYRAAILRASATDLDRTTRETFFKICPPEAYSNGGRVDSRNKLTLDNGSILYWMHLDDYDEQTVRGLELNSYLIDQAEEINESIYLHLDSRIGRWDQAEIPPDLKNEKWPLNEGTGKPMPPSYGMILCNPDVKSHWIYKRYHPESSEHHKLRLRYDRKTGKTIEYRYSDTHMMVQASSYDNPALSEETLANMESRGESFKKRFVLGEWGSSGGSVHEIQAESKIYGFPRQLLEQIVKKGETYISLDHGDASPTCATWFTKYDKWIFVWQEYYKANTPISQHRENIAYLNLFKFSEYKDSVHLKTQNVADPSIFKKNQQKNGGIFSLADEYITSEYKVPPLHLTPADNNEFVTRSRINEALRKHPNIPHPVTGEMNAPMLYFVMKGVDHPNGCDHIVSETESQKYVKLGVLDGEDLYGDDRDDKIVDHAYDTLRYGLARIFQHMPAESQEIIDKESTFSGARLRAIKMQRQYKRLAGIDPHSYGREY